MYAKLLKKLFKKIIKLAGAHKFIHSRKKLSVTVFPGWKDLVTVFLASIKTYSKRLGLTCNFDLELGKLVLLRFR